MTHWKYKAQFGGLVLVGLLFTGFAVKRGMDSADRVQKQLNAIQHNTEQPAHVTVNPTPVVVNNPPIKHHTHLAYVTPTDNPTSEPLFPLHENQEPKINISFYNIGNVAADATFSRAVFLEPVSTLENSEENEAMFRRFLRDAKYGGCGTMMPSSPGGEQRRCFSTAIAPKLNASDVSELNSGKKVLCAVGRAYWHDESGNYQSDYCQCIGAQVPFINPDKPIPFNWMSCPNHNHETRLK